MPKNLHVAFVADPLPSFDPVAETTFFLMSEACHRRWSCYHLEPKDLVLKNSQLFGHVKEIKVERRQSKFTYKVLTQKFLDLSKMAAIFLRKDPPVDSNFIEHLSLLEIIAKQTLLVNDPTAIKFAGEKLYPLYFAEFTPPTLVAKNRQSILDFFEQHKTLVLKPLNLSGGRGVVKISLGDPSTVSLIDVLTHQGKRYLLAQKFIPAAKHGDKRLLLLDGEVLGAFLRVPAKNDFRGNLHSGATLKKCQITARDLAIVAALKKDLMRRKLYFVGLDILGGYLTEVNATSPMGIREINYLENVRLEKTVMDWVKKTTQL